MRNENNRRSLFAQAPHETEQIVHLMQCERGGGLIHDQDLSIDRKGTRDLHHLLLCNAQRASLLLEVELHAKGLEQFARLGIQLAPVHATTCSDGLSADENILGDIQVRKETQLLINSCDPRLA